MINRMIVLLTGIALTRFLFPSTEVDVGEIIRKVDRLYRSQSSYSLIEMEIVTPHWQRTLKMKAWSQGMENFLVRILEPKKERGVASLKIGPEMWNYLPNTNKVIKIPPSMMMGSWMGSDFTNDDLVKEYTFFDDYTFRLLKEENAPPSYLIECIPKPGIPVIWGKIVIGVDKENALPLFQKYYNEKGELAREMNFSEVKTFGRQKIPSVLELLPLNQKGKKTVIRYLEIDFDTPVHSALFSLSALRAGGDRP